VPAFQSSWASAQPAGQRLALADGGRPAGQDQKGGLEGVLPVLLVAQHGPANVQHQRPVPAQQGGEGAVVPADGKPIQEFLVAQGLTSDLVELLEHRATGFCGHGSHSWGRL
jgi:hypothetical protein